MRTLMSSHHNSNNIEILSHGTWLPPNPTDTSLQGSYAPFSFLSPWDQGVCTHCPSAWSILLLGPMRLALSSPSGSPCLKVSSLIWSKAPPPHPMLPVSVRMGPRNSVPTLKDSCVKFSSNWHCISHLFPWCFNAAYGLVPWAAAQITYPLVWFSLSHSTINVKVNVSQKHYASFTNPTTEGFNRLFYWFINFFLIQCHFDHLCTFGLKVLWISFW